MSDELKVAHLEVVAKRPIAQHLEKGVVIRVFADIVQICTVRIRLGLHE
jgi:hypothetical protein